MPLQSQVSQRSRRAAAVGLVLALLPALWGGLGVISRASADTAPSITLCSGFDSCSAKGMSHDGYKTAKSNMYWNMYSGVNCTNYVAYRMIRAGMASARPAQLKAGKGNATYWGGSFGSLTNATPTVGAVAWWKANTNGVGSAGHVARVEQVLTNGDIVISESNYGSEFTWRQLAKGGSRWPSGFIHLKDAVLTASTAPTVAAAPRVGVAVKANVGAWSPAPTSYKYQWYAGGVAIAGATAATFTPTSTQLAKTLQVSVAAARAGYATGSRASAASAAVAPGTQTVTENPTITGTPQVDETLTADPGVYTPGADKVSLQWLANNEPIAGATASTFVPNKEQADARLAVKVTAVKSGYTTLVRTSSPTAPIVAPNIRVSAASISGAHLVGQKLTANVRTADPVQTTTTYNWLRDGVPIGSARAATYLLKPADVGHRIGLRVTVDAHGYLSRTFDIASFSGIKTPLKASIRTDVRKDRTVWVKVLLVPPAGLKPGGRVDVKVGKQLKHGTLLKNGTVRLHFTRPGIGARPIKVYYGGNSRFLKTKAAGTVTIPAKHAVAKAKKSGAKAGKGK